MARLFANGGDGVIAGDLSELLVFGDGSPGLNVKISTGSAWVRGTYYTNDAQITQSLATAPGALTSRIDLIILRNDFAANQTTVQVLTGTAASNPVAPTPTQSSVVWEIPIAAVRVGTSVTVINAADVFDERSFVWATIPTAYLNLSNYR